MFPNLDWKTMRTVTPNRWDEQNDVLIYGSTPNGNYMVGEAWGRNESAQNEIEDLLPVESVEKVAKLFAISPKLYQALDRLVNVPAKDIDAVNAAWERAREVLAMLPGGLDGFSE